MLGESGASALQPSLIVRKAVSVSALAAIPPHLKASDQAGKQGSLIFDPVGTNFAIKEELVSCGWKPNVRMPAQFNFLGTDVDFVSNGVLAEVQFSNYPFLLNNTVRAELLFKSQAPVSDTPIKALIIIAKARMFPASNSTLYYEQAVKQLNELSRNRVLDIPIRLVGLFAGAGQVEAAVTTYHNPRYSRTIVERSVLPVTISAGRTVDGLCKFELSNR